MTSMALKTLLTGIIPIVHSRDGARSADGKRNQILRTRNRDALGINDLGAHQRDAIPARGQPGKIRGQNNFCRRPGRAQLVGGDGLAMAGARHGPQNSRGERHTPITRGGVSIDFPDPQRLIIQEEFHRFGMGIHLHIFLMRGQIARRPIGKQNLGMPFFRPIAGVGGHELRAGDAASQSDHGGRAPPALPLASQRADGTGAVQQTRSVTDDRPPAGFAQIINTGP